MIRVPREGALTAGQPQEASDEASIQVSLLTWNILAPCFVEAARHCHVDPLVLDWEFRVEKIINELISAEADIILFQEVMPSIFENDLEPRLASLGYGCVGPQQKSQAGNASFYREDKLSLSWTEHRSRVLLLGLQAHAGGPEIVVANAHLEGDPEQSIARVQQAKSALQRAAQRNGGNHAFILAGDFNAPLASSAVASYLSFGFVVPGVVEFGREVANGNLNAEPAGHPYKLESAYAPDAQEFSFTLRGASGFCGMLDQVWYDTEALRCIGTRSCFRSDEHKQQVYARGLPSIEDPSDHLPLGACFQLLKAPTRERLQVGNRTPTLGEDASADEILAEAALLWENCPMTEEERQTWRKLDESVAAATPAPGVRPSNEALQALSIAKAARQSFIDSLSEDSKQAVVRLLELKKAEKKARDRASRQQGKARIKK